jgi:hypothetical protein
MQGEEESMFRRFGHLPAEVRRKIHSFSVGTTLALGVIVANQLGQSCALTGQ